MTRYCTCDASEIGCEVHPRPRTLRIAVSVSQFCELLALEPGQFVGVEFAPGSTTVTLVLEPADHLTPRVKGK